jgi:sugar/nucleoside kinase (ribokinase family)
LYVTSLSGESAKLLFPIVTTAKKANIPVATNPGTSQLIAGAPMLRESLPYIDILITNSAEAKTFMLSLVQTNEQIRTSVKKTTSRAQQQQKPSLLSQPISIENILFSLDTYFQAVLEHGPKIVVVTNGAEGVYVGTPEAIYFHPALPIKVINTLGAGDAFGSSFVGSLASGKSVEDAIRHGIINSASVIGYMNTKQGLLSMKELEQRAEQLDQKLLQKFPLKS